MDCRCRHLTIIKNEKGGETWLCYHQHAKRGLIQSCFLKTGPCRYSNGPFPPEPRESDPAEEDSKGRP